MSQTSNAKLVSAANNLLAQFGSTMGDPEYWSGEDIVPNLQKKHLFIIVLLSAIASIILTKVLQCKTS
jgi:hypothetical protein